MGIDNEDDKTVGIEDEDDMIVGTENEDGQTADTEDEDDEMVDAEDEGEDTVDTEDEDDVIVDAEDEDDVSDDISRAGRATAKRPSRHRPWDEDDADYAALDDSEARFGNRRFEPPTSIDKIRWPFRVFTRKKQTEVCEMICRDVKGQDEAVMTMVESLYAEARLKMGRLAGERAEEQAASRPLLIVGHTASGKTHLIKTLAHVLKMNLFTIDSTQLTGQGWAGQSLHEALYPLAQAQAESPFDLTILLFDEFDKARRDRDTTRNPSFNPQQDFLTFIETTGKLNLHLKQVTSTPVELDMDMVFPVFLGAFEGIEEYVDARTKSSKPLGFAPVIIKEDQDAGLTLPAQVTKKDLIAYGMRSELMGRLGDLVLLGNLDRDILRSIVVEGPNSIVAKFNRFMPKDVKIIFDDSAVEHAIDRVESSDLGVRELESCLSAPRNRAFRYCEENPDIRTVSIFYDDEAGDFMFREETVEPWFPTEPITGEGEASEMGAA